MHVTRVLILEHVRIKQVPLLLNRSRQALADELNTILATG